MLWLFLYFSPTKIKSGKHEYDEPIVIGSAHLTFSRYIPDLIESVGTGHIPSSPPLGPSGPVLTTRHLIKRYNDRFCREKLPEI